MRIESIEWKNFNSYGNSVQSINFTKREGDLYLLLGGNGNGKSTISEVITFALYGKVENKNKSDLPNRINKNLWCRIQIVSRNKKITVTRGVSPGLFEVEIDGAPYETAGNANVQTYLETEIYDIPYQVFKNILVLSVNDFKSFLTMSTGDKRNIIDRLFGLSIINQMRDEIKGERRELKDQIKTIESELTLIEESIDSITSKIKDLEKTKKEDRVNLIKEYIENVKDLLSKKQKVDSDLVLIRNKNKEVGELLKEKSSKKLEIDNEIKSMNRKVDLYKQHKCPTCERDFDKKESDSAIDELTKKINTDLDISSEINIEIQNVNAAIKKISDKIQSMNDESIRTSMRINQYKSEAEKLKNEVKTQDKDYLNQLINENQEKKTDRESDKITKRNEDSFLEGIESVLGDDGIKNMAMKVILPPLNQTILNMAAQIHLPYSIQFNDKFDCIIKSIGEEISPKSMSTGERKKADFIIIIALLKMLKVRYPSINLLFLDEIFSSIDSAGIYEIIKILRETSKESDLNTWVINHAELPLELFDRRVEATKEGGFSKLLIEEVS
jgi:exonuclease SbcC